MKSHSVFSRRIPLFIIILALSSQACAISLLEWPPFPTTNPPDQNIPTGPTATPAPRAEMTFTVRLPEPLPPNEILALSVLDEVTGLALNPVDYQMTPLDATTYTVLLTIRSE